MKVKIPCPKCRGACVRGGKWKHGQWILKKCRKCNGKGTVKAKKRKEKA